MKFRYNPYCSCSRCRAHGFMGPVVLITIGVLFLLSQVGHASWMDVGSTWPALLIVIGLILFLQHNASAEGHVPVDYRAMVQPGRPGQPIPPGAQPYPPPPPAPPAGASTPDTNWNSPQNPNEPEVHHG